MTVTAPGRAVESGRLRTRVPLVGLLVTAWVLPAAFVRATDGARTTADEPHYLMTAISLGEDFDLDVSDERRDQRYRVFHEAPLLLQAEVADDGSRISPHDPGLPALLAAPVRIGGWVGAKILLALTAGALAAATFWVAVRRFGVSLGVATLTVLSTAAAAPLAVYGTQVYPEIVAGLAVVLGIAALTGRADARSAAVAASVVVALPWLGVKYVPVAVVIGALSAVQLRRSPRAFALLMAVGAVGGLIYVLAHQAWYGGLTAYAAGSHFVDGELTVVGNDPDYFGRAIRLVGLLTDRSFGLIAWQPLYLLMLPAVGALAVRRPRGWAALLLPLAAGWFVATFVALTMHGWWFPGRQVVHVLPAAVLAMAWFVSTRPGLALLVAAAGALGASMYVWLLVEGLAGGLNLIVTFESLSHPWWRLGQVLLPDYRALGAGGWIAHLLGLAIVVGLVVLGVVCGQRDESRPGGHEVNAPEQGPIWLPLASPAVLESRSTPRPREVN